jgi:rSAM/selenodomain-associated transferase 1
VLVFARDPDAGPVKTRLAATIGDAAARTAYRRLAETVWRGLEHPRLERRLWVAPAASVASMAAWLCGADAVLGQPEADLGARLDAAFAEAFAHGAPWAAAVGTDAPTLDATMVLRAGAALDEHDAAIVPALDGGYALLALARPAPELFGAMPWSTPRLLEATLARVAELGWSAAVLTAVRDVDDAADLAAWEASLRRSGPSATPPSRPA